MKTVQAAYVIQVAMLLAAAALAEPGCGGHGEGLRERLLTYDAALQRATVGSEAELEGLESKLVEETKADPDAVIAIYERDPYWGLRTDCAGLLVRAGIKKAAPHLARGVQLDPDPRVAQSSLSSLWLLLRQYGSDGEVREQALAAAHEALGRSKPFAVYMALSIVGDLKDPSSIEVLVRALPRVKSRSWTEVVDAIHEIGGKEAKEALRRIRSEQKDSKRVAHLDELLKS